MGIAYACLAAWMAASALLVPLLRRDYRAGRVRAGTGVLIWSWHGLNYSLLVVFSLEEIWTLGLPAALRGLGFGLAAAGVAVIAAGFYEFHSVRRLTGSQRDELIDTGIYRFSRHPQYLGIILTLIGGGLAGDSGAAVLLSIALSAGLLAYLPIEERYIAGALGEDYERYRSRVPILAGLPTEHR